MGCINHDIERSSKYTEMGVQKMTPLFVLYLCMIVAHAQNVNIGEIGIFSYDVLGASGGLHSNIGLYCDGQIVAIADYDALFNLIGTQYGGDGVSTFALPDLRGRTPIGMGQGPGLSPYVMGQMGGEHDHTIMPSEIPGYTSVSITSAISDPANNATCAQGTLALAEVNGVCSSEVIQTPVTFTVSAGALPRENTMKSVPLYFVIYTQGVYPSQSKREAEDEKEEEEEEGEAHHHETKDISPAIGQISLYGFNFAPKGWAPCNGQILAINQNQALFAILGTTYGGDGTTRFQLPDLRGRAVFSDYQSPLGSQFGNEKIQLTTQNTPIASTLTLPSVGSNSPRFCDTTQTAFVARTMCSATTTQTTVQVSGSQSAAQQNNLQPYLSLNFAIATQGIFPSRNKRDFTMPYLGEMRLFAGNFAPANWALAQGQVLSIAQNQALYAKLGTTFGGDGITTFALPNMNGAIPVGQGTMQGSGRTFTVGETQGQTMVTLTSQNIPNANFNGQIPTTTARSPVTTSCGLQSNAFQINNICSDETTFNTPTNAGSSNADPIDITKPALQLNWIIALTGVF